MSSLLKLLNEGFAAVRAEEMTGSDVPVGKKERVIYEIQDDELRRFLTFLGKHAKALKQKMDEETQALPENHLTEAGHIRETCPACILDAKKLASMKMYNELWDLFWAHLKESVPPSVQMKMNEAGKTSIRAGWKIAITPKGETETFDFGPIKVMILPLPDSNPHMN